MLDESESPSPLSALVALAPLDPEWQPILHLSNQIVLYNPTSHALSIRKHRDTGSSLVYRHAGNRCPFCHRALPTEVHPEQREEESDVESVLDLDIDDDPHIRPRSRAANYFQLLQIANDSASRPATGRSTRTIPIGSLDGTTDGTSKSGAFSADKMAEGYFKAFFKEEGRLGMGANGSVFLCQHMLDGNPLGHFAVKKIAVGQSHLYLLNILREVRLLERLHHPNIITYHHAWLETCQFSSFGPQVPTLHVLMQWAEGGSLDDFIDARLGRRTPTFAHAASASVSSSPNASPAPEAPSSPNPNSRSARIKAFRALQRAPPGERERLKRELGLAADGLAGGKGPADWKAVHLLSAEELKSLFGDVVSGLAFLHEKSILHLDLKPGNVLLTWDEGRLVPRAMLSDFGTSQDMLKSRARSGNTGTLEYSSPESLPSPTGQLLQVDSKSDMWSVGMILHKLLFFKLPYANSSDNTRDGREASDALEREVQMYAGFKPSASLATAFESRRLPRAYLMLLEGLLNINPSIRPSSDRVLGAIREGRLDPLRPDPAEMSARSGSLVPVPIRRVLDAASSFVESTPQTPDLHARVSAELDAGATSPPRPAQGEEKKKKLLGVPVPTLAFNTSGVWARTVHVGGRQVLVRIPRVMWPRTVKSCLLMLKVWSMTRVCPDARPHLLFTTLVLGAAVTDTWFDSLSLTFMLAAFHVSVVRLACWSGRCCV
ncbi:kinase-like protein [Daedalea quercina L-15889]|uniref:non-specific serine/threonine protein kinase n=1 Tax=Daedalea quercina L-15889 TaxID=1314783 RepID=A0A165N683_9APHY|nr:kinase-like protein [Daedalea quercina L-15889]